jgi:predicted phage terminase large subunit-like protein
VNRLNADLIYGFTTSLLLSRFDSPKPTPQFHWELWDLFCKEDRQVAIAAPRGHAKSTAITHTCTLASVLFRERDFVLLVSDTETQAIQFLGDIKKELQENEDLIEAFGIRRFIKDTESDIIVEFNDGAQFRIIAKGSEQKVRGMKWRNKRPNLVIGDDLENDEIVLNEDRRFKFRQWFFNALIPVGSDDCIYRIVGTILHMDSMLERLMPEWGAGTTKTDGIRHWSIKRTSWTSIRYQAHSEDYSLLLWPEKFPKERLLEIRETYIDQGFPEGYAQEYLNYPIDEENAFFRHSDFLPIEDYEEYLEYYVGGDLAISEKDTRAYSVFVVAGMNSKGILKIVDVIRARMDSKEIVDELFALHNRYTPEAFFVEKENIARSIGPFLTEEQINRGVYLNIGEDTLIVPTQDKMKRAQPIRARARAGTVQIDTEAFWYETFLTEHLQFPRGVYKDQVDALAMIGLGLAKMSIVPTAQEIEDLEWEDEYNESAIDFDTRDWLTGY